MNILVTGITGQLGYDVAKCLNAREIPCVGAGRAELDLADGICIRQYIQKVRPDAVIHCAAYTDVNRAQSERELCRAVNVEGTKHIAAVCQELGAKLLFVSTEYVFPGEGDGYYRTTDATAPLNVYGESKRDAELAVAECMERYFIVRISCAFGAHGKNFVSTMLKLGREKEEIRVVCDQIGSPTYTVDLAELLCDMVMTEKYGVYHATNEGVCSFAELAQEVMRQAGLSAKIIPILAKDYPSPAIRPKNSRLDKSSLDCAGFCRLPEWKDALRRYLKEIGV
ncbi:MAG: dTDP-4-dehydrorhamnose reductase [Lachnospiraceae bacterium]|nr:dTDP-4-dehydrorhamnose reductase [Lachnospiraceae bacterium]